MERRASLQPAPLAPANCTCSSESASRYRTALRLIVQMAEALGADSSFRLATALLLLWEAGDGGTSILSLELQLSRWLGHASQSSTSRNARLLREKGLAEYAIKKTDGRVILRITGKGHALVASLSDPRTQPPEGADHDAACR